MLDKLTRKLWKINFWRNSQRSVAANYSKPTDSLQKLISEMQEPLYDAPEESKTIKLVEQGFGGVEYKILVNPLARGFF